MSLKSKIIEALAFSQGDDYPIGPDIYRADNPIISSGINAANLVRNEKHKLLTQIVIPLSVFSIVSGIIPYISVGILPSFGIVGVVTNIIAQFFQSEIDRKYRRDEEYLCTLGSGDIAATFLASSIKQGYLNGLYLSNMLAYLGIALTSVTMFHMITHPPDYIITVPINPSNPPEYLPQFYPDRTI